MGGTFVPYRLQVAIPVDSDSDPFRDGEASVLDSPEAFVDGFGAFPSAPAFPDVAEVAAERPFGI